MMFRYSDLAIGSWRIEGSSRSHVSAGEVSVGTLIIRIGFRGIYTIITIKSPQNSIGKFVRDFSRIPLLRNSL